MANHDITDFDIGSIDSSIDLDAVQRYRETAARAFQRRVAKEVLGCWMAGYAALDVIVDPAWPISDAADADDLLTMKASFAPSHVAREPTGYPRNVSVQRYDMEKMTTDHADTIRDRLRGDDDA